MLFCAILGAFFDDLSKKNGKGYGNITNNKKALKSFI